LKEISSEALFAVYKSTEVTSQNEEKRWERTSPRSRQRIKKKEKFQPIYQSVETYTELRQSKEEKDKEV